MKTLALFGVLCVQLQIGFSRPGYGWDHRPSFQPDPSDYLISQIVPPGKPWPANAEDYYSFTQITQKPNYSPPWASTRKPSTIPDKKHVDNSHWSRPMILFHKPENQTKHTVTIDESGKLPGVQQLAGGSTIRPISLDKAELFTSAPVAGAVLSSDGEASLANISVANLLPENEPVTVRKPVDSANVRNQRARSAEFVDKQAAESKQIEYTADFVFP